MVGSPETPQTEGKLDLLTRQPEQEGWASWVDSWALLATGPETEGEPLLVAEPLVTR